MAEPCPTQAAHSTVLLHPQSPPVPTPHLLPRLLQTRRQRLLLHTQRLLLHLQRLLDRSSGCRLQGKRAGWACSVKSMVRCKHQRQAKRARQLHSYHSLGSGPHPTCLVAAASWLVRAPLSPSSDATCSAARSKQQARALVQERGCARKTQGVWLGEPAPWSGRLAGSGICDAAFQRRRPQRDSTAAGMSGEPRPPGQRCISVTTNKGIRAACPHPTHLDACLLQLRRQCLLLGRQAVSACTCCNLLLGGGAAQASGVRVMSQAGPGMARGQQG